MILVSYVDLCKSSPCFNEGRCHKIGNGSYLCYCSPGWIGKNCLISKLKRINLFSLNLKILNTFINFSLHYALNFRPFRKRKYRMFEYFNLRNRRVLQFWYVRIRVLWDVPFYALRCRECLWSNGLNHAIRHRWLQKTMCTTQNV